MCYSYSLKEATELAQHLQGEIANEEPDMYVVVVYISHKHGHDIAVHATDASAVTYVADYCRLWWDDCPAAQRMEMPEDEQARIDAYFDENESEFLEMSTVPIQGKLDG